VSCYLYCLPQPNPPGRTFQSLEDINAQALAWSTVRMDNKPQGKTGLIPAKAFEHERTHLTQLRPSESERLTRKVR
jgi:uncharacterized protein (DUF2384 family)